MGFAKIDFTITDDEDFAATFELTDASTNQEYDASALDFEMEVTENGSALLSASTDAGTLTQPENHQVAFRFTQAQVEGALYAGRTYQFGLVSINGSGHRTQVALGTVAVVDGGMAN